MAYVCPVCEEPQVDGEHLANHMAFTALLEGDEHESWLDEHAPDWEEGDDAALAERLVETVDRVDHPIDETGGDHAGHDHGHGGQDPRVDPRAGGSNAGGGFGSIDEEAADVLEDARELTRRMQDEDETTEDPQEADGESESADE